MIRAAMALLLLFCWCAGAFGEFAVRTWNVDDGLPSSSVLAIAQTTDGYLWLGTPRGLVRFDGLHFTVYESGTTPGLSDNGIHSLFADSRGRLWIGTESGGIVMMRRGRFSPAPDIPVGSADRQLVSVCEDSDGSVWLLNKNKELWRYDGERCSLFYLHLPKEGNAADPSLEGRSIIRVVDGPVMAATDGRETSMMPDPGSPDGVRLSVGYSGNIDKLVPGRAAGYWRLADGQITRLPSTKLPPTNCGPYPWQSGGFVLIKMRAACEDNDGNLVLGTHGAGVFVVACGTNGGANLSTTNGLSNDYVLSLLVDREGTLWVGTDGGGLNRIKQKTFTEIPGLPGAVTRSLTEDAAGTIWIGTRGDGVSRWISNSVLQRLQVPVQAPQFVDAIFADNRNQVWLGTPGVPLWPAARWQGTAFERIISPALPPAVQVIFQDRAGTLWLGTDHGIVRHNGTGWTRFSVEQGLMAETITAIAEDAEGHLWIGARHGGVTRMDGQQFTAVEQPDAAPEDVAALIVDRDNTVWVSTVANGLLRYAAGKWTRYKTREGLPSNDLTYILDGGDDSLWIGSNAGVLRVSKRQLEEIASGRRAMLQCRAYAKPDGLPTAECTWGSQPAALRDSRGRLWFPTTKGPAFLDPSQLRPNSNAPPVVIQTVLVDNREMPLTNTLALGPGNERLEFRFAALNLRAPERAQFKYWLQGHETAWVEAGDRRVVSYSRLPPGHYTFRVTACNEDGVWNELGSQVAVIVQPPIWRTWWFITALATAAILAIAGAVYLVSTQRYQRELAALRQQEALEKERARIARDIHDQVGASLTQVALLGELVEADKSSPDDVQGHATQICQTARETTRALDEIVWTVNPSNDTLEGLVNYICKYAQDYLGVAGIKYRLDVPAHVPSAGIAPDVRHNVFLAAKEAITNIVRHARAGSAWVRIRVEPASFVVEVEDNGRGLADLDPQRARTRHGLSNMRKRMEDIGGQFSLEPGREGGALVRLTVPLPESARKS